MLLRLGLLAMLIYFAYGKSFAHTMEYRFEYDPKKNERPVVEWRYDDMMGPRQHQQLYPRTPSDVRKSPRRYYTPDEEPDTRTTSEPINNGWRNGGYRRAESKLEHEEFVEVMAAELRRRSEEILASHFPHFPFQFYDEGPRQYQQEWYPQA